MYVLIINTENESNEDMDSKITTERVSYIFASFKEKRNSNSTKDYTIHFEANRNYIVLLKIKILWCASSLIGSNGVVQSWCDARSKGRKCRPEIFRWIQRENPHFNLVEIKFIMSRFHWLDFR